MADQRSSKRLVTTTEMVASAAYDYIRTGERQMLQRVLRQRVDGIIWGTQRYERQVFITLIDNQLKGNPSEEAKAALEVLKGMVDELEFIVGDSR